MEGGRVGAACRQAVGGGGGGGAATAGSGSGGSAGESSEDEGFDEQEEGFGRAEEEVAQLLVRLGKTDTYFEGFSDAEDDVRREARLPTDRDGGGGGDGVVSRPRAVLHGAWGVGVAAGGGGSGGIHGRGGGGRYS